MNVTTIQMAREQASVQYELYRDAVKKRREPYLNDLRVLYGAMRKGKVVLDVWQSFRETGLDENGDPKIAIARADTKTVELRKSNDTGRPCARFSDPEDQTRHRSNYNPEANGVVLLPEHLFAWKTEVRKRQYREASGQTREYEETILLRREVKTKVPIVPVALLPPHGLANYHTLWEVEKWDLVTPPKDPLLLKRVSPNMFVVLATWELTELERAVLRGRIA